MWRWTGKRRRLWHLPTVPCRRAAPTHTTVPFFVLPFFPYILEKGDIPTECCSLSFPVRSCRQDHTKDLAPMNWARRKGSLFFVRWSYRPTACCVGALFSTCRLSCDWIALCLVETFCAFFPESLTCVFLAVPLLLLPLSLSLSPFVYRSGSFPLGPERENTKRGKRPKNARGRV